jgi:drug/metabolite transporter (DMT)-like permease
MGDMALIVVFASLLYAVFGLLVSQASKRSDAYLENAIFNGLGALIPLAVYLVLKLRHTQVHTSKQGIMYSLLAGVAIAAFSVILAKLFARGGNVAYVLPVIYGGVVVFGSLMGWAFLKEQISPLQLAGIIVTTCGVGMIIAARA